MTDRIRAGADGLMMKSFYYAILVPFVINKRRFVLLAAASYIALC